MSYKLRKWIWYKFYSYDNYNDDNDANNEEQLPYYQYMYFIIVTVIIISGTIKNLFLFSKTFSVLHAKSNGWNIE